MHMNADSIKLEVMGLDEAAARADLPTYSALAEALRNLMDPELCQIKAPFANATVEPTVAAKDAAAALLARLPV